MPTYRLMGEITDLHRQRRESPHRDEVATTVRLHGVGHPRVRGDLHLFFDTEFAPGIGDNISVEVTS